MDNIFSKSNLENCLHQLNSSNDVRVFCPVCGELEIKNGDILHPQLDMIIKEMLDNSFTVNYVE